MVGRHDGHACCSCLRVSLEVNLFGPPLGLLHSLVEILGEGGEEGIGQNDHLVMVLFAHVRIRQNDYFLILLAVGRRKANLGEVPRWTYFPKYVPHQRNLSSEASLCALSCIPGDQRRGVPTQMSRLEQTLNKPVVVLVVGVIAVALNVLLYFGYFLPKMTPLIGHINPIGISLPEVISKAVPETGSKPDPETGSKSDPEANGTSGPEASDESVPEVSLKTVFSDSSSASSSAASSASPSASSSASSAASPSSQQQSSSSAEASPSQQASPPPPEASPPEVQYQ